MAGPKGLFRNLKGTTEDLFRIGKSGPLFQRIVSTARLRLPDLLRWLPGGAAIVGHLQSDSSGDLSVVKDNLSASSAPTVGDDSNDGYSVDSRWLDLTNDKVYICLDASVGAAVWREVTVTGSQVRSFPAQKDFNEKYVKFNPGSTYTLLKPIIFEGSTVEGVFTKCYALLAHSNPSGRTIDIRLYDKTNSNTVAEATDLTFTTADEPEIKELTITPANIPSGQAIFEIQVATPDGGDGQYFDLLLRFK